MLVVDTRQVLLAGFLSAPGVSLLIALALVPGRTLLFYLSFVLLGLLCMPIMPTVIATAAECMYPVMETYSTGVLALVRREWGELVVRRRRRRMSRKMMVVMRRMTR
jgi:hypothetical protein